MLPTPGFYSWTFDRTRDFYVDFVKTEGGPADPSHPIPSHPIHLTGMPRETPRGSPRLPECLALRTALVGLLFCVDPGLAGISRASLGQIPLLKSQGFRMGFSGDCSVW